jgi:hypothetical protein
VGTPVAEGELYRWLKLEPPTKEALDVGASYPPGACNCRYYSRSTSSRSPPKAWSLAADRGSGWRE